MNYEDMFVEIPDEECPFFFEEERPLRSPEDLYYKIYHDGLHHVATVCYKSNRKGNKQGHSKEAIDMLFDDLYFNGLRAGYKRRYLSEFIKAGILELFPDYENIDGFIKDKIKRKLHNIFVRKKRFKRKAYLNRWNYFVTFTYDDKKQSEDTFRKKLRKCLSNLHTRRGWRYMGIFERAPETGRLHFHGLLYIPDGEMIGEIEERRDYSTAQRKMQTTHINLFFEDVFGRNDFEELDENIIRHTPNLDYILKYIAKSGERVVYSRGIPAEICKKLSEEDIASDYLDFVEKYVLFDDVIDWERDVMHYKPIQMNLLNSLVRERTR